METVRLFRNYEPTTSPHFRLRRLVMTSRLRLTGVLQTLETRGTVRENSSLGVPAHICAVGLYFRGDHLRSLVTRLLKRSLAPENIKTKLSASLRPKGSLSLTQKGQAYARPNSHKRYLLAISMIYCIMEQIATHPASATICIRAIVN